MNSNGNEKKCHCGKPIIHHNLGENLSFTRDLCSVCDTVRCDAFPGACRELAETKERIQNGIRK